MPAERSAKHGGSPRRGAARGVGRAKSAQARDAAVVRDLGAWYDDVARDLPWRRTRDPYAIWVSEIMLQQTQVKTVIPYWERWLCELPTIISLANASSEKIHKLWEGLGYYTRVRNLQKAAQTIVANHDGEFPTEFTEVLALLGIGRYTAGAICSIAFNHPTPILDGNVIRVLTRIFAIDGNPREKRTNLKLWRIAEELVLHASRLTRDSACSHLNQSLMELGALICAPRSPQCRICPVKNHCLAFQRNKVERFPNLDKRVAPTDRQFVAFLLEHQGKILVRQRPAGVVNAHLWEFPNVELSADMSEVQFAARRVLGFKPKTCRPLCRIRHSITRYRITLDAFTVSYSSKAIAKTQNGSWRTIAELKELSFPSAHRKILSRLQPD